jgi:hypothetical protein
MGETVAYVEGQDLQLSIDSRFQFFAYQSCVMPCCCTRPRPAVWWWTLAQARSLAVNASYNRTSAPKPQRGATQKQER